MAEEGSTRKDFPRVNTHYTCKRTCGAYSLIAYLFVRNWIHGLHSLINIAPEPLSIFQGTFL